ncbi:MAG: Dabb family protein [Sandaracinaceae bacterium]
MLTHVVLFQMNEPVAENAEAVAARLRAMEGVVAGLASITVGVDVNRGPRAYDVCLITTHADETALSAYQADAAHGEVKAFIGEVSRGVAVVDFASPDA